MRFHKDGESQVRHALTMCQKHIEDDGGRILGLARPYGVSASSILGVWYGRPYRDQYVIVICVSFPIKYHTSISQFDMPCICEQRRLRRCASSPVSTMIARTVIIVDKGSCRDFVGFILSKYLCMIVYRMNTHILGKFPKSHMMTLIWDRLIEMLLISTSNRCVLFCVSEQQKLWRTTELLLLANAIQ